MKKPEILVVAPYGIAVRDLLYNDAIRAFFANDVEADMVSPIRLSPLDDWGIRLNQWPEPVGLKAKILLRISGYAQLFERMSSWREFHMAAGWHGVFAATRGVQKLSGNVGSWQQRMWSMIARIPGLRILRRIANSLQRFDPVTTQILNRTDYDLIVVIHTVDPTSISFMKAASRRGIPTICIAMGSDNLHSGGPMLAAPNHLLVWGDEQKLSVVDHHARYYAPLRRTRVSVIGALPHDLLLPTLVEDEDYFRSTYPEIKREDVVITFATYAQLANPGQKDICTTILSVFGGSKTKCHLIVRNRPGIDTDFWQEYSKNIDASVYIQEPTGALFTKWDGNYTAERDSEMEDIQLYRATLRRSNLVITSGYSTVCLDAYALGTPSVPTTAGSSDDQPSFLRWMYNEYAKSLPFISELPFANTHDEIRRHVENAMSRNRSTETLELMRSTFEAQIGHNDGQAGDRLVQVLKEAVQKSDNPMT
jgi:hypothetical protein